MALIGERKVPEDKKDKLITVLRYTMIYKSLALFNGAMDKYKTEYGQMKVHLDWTS
jgi:hypothetical protein